MKGSLARARMAGLSCVAALVAVGLASCSSSGAGHDGQSSQATGASVTSAAAADGLAALLPARIAKSKKLVVGVQSAGASNMELTSGTKIIGFDPDLIKAIGNKLGLSVEVKPASFDSLIAGVQSSRFDVSIGEMADTKTRQETVSFVDYLNIGVAVVVKKGNPAHIQGPDDLCGKSVALATGGYPQTTLVPALSAACTKAGKPAIRPLSFKDSTANVLAVQTGRADSLFGDAAVAAYLLKTNPGQFEQVGSAPTTLARAGIAFAKADPQLGTAIKAALTALMKSGEYATIAKRWDLTAGMISEASINDALI